MNKHEVEWAAWDYYQSLDSHHMVEKKHYNNHTNAFEAGVEWAEKTLIDKACKWLQENVSKYSYVMKVENTEYRKVHFTDSLIEDFKKAMEE